MMAYFLCCVACFIFTVFDRFRRCDLQWVIGALEEFAFTSYYSSNTHKSAMSNNHQNFYRPYDIESTYSTSSNISKVTNGVGVVHSAGSLGNRNVLGNSSYYALADLNEKTSAATWPHFPDTSSYSHQRSQESTYPIVIQAAPIPPTFSSDLFLSQQNHQHQPFASVSSSNESHQQQQQHQLPIRPIPRQANSVLHRTRNYPFIFPECGRYCSSSGAGLKREFCHVVRAKLNNKNNNANHADRRTKESESTFHYPYYHVDSGPLNLSTDGKFFF